METISASGTAGSTGRRLARRLAVLAGGALAASALMAPSALALSGAIYTSNFDGSIINENTGYTSKSDVYLTGGPCNGGSHLAEGEYYFQVTSPNGKLLSSDSIGNRHFVVGANGFIASTGGSHVTHAVNCSPPVTGITIQLMPYKNTPNAGGEYKLSVATADSVEACSGFAAGSTSFKFCNGADQKSDNYKVEPEVPAEPDIQVVKTADPTELPFGGGSVTYTYEVKNIGNVALTNVSIDDDKCDAITEPTSDGNDDALLDVGETWTYTCTMEITVTTTNTVDAQGFAGEVKVTDSDTAEVTVLPDPDAPGIHVDKSADPESLPVGGGSVTYTYEVTNTGNVPLSNVTIEDDKCSPISGPTGDVNSDDKLDTDETWTYTCTMDVEVTTENVVTVEGTYGEGTVSDTDNAVVTVAGATLPNTGTAKPTLPSTSTIDGKGGNGGSPIALLLILLAAGTAGLVALSPLPKRIRR